MRSGVVLGALAATLLASRAVAAASDEPICADRPGLATPTCTVPRGLVQVETGLVDWVHDHSRGTGTDELVVGQTALKFGLNDRFHLEVDITPYQRVHERDGASSISAGGFGDLELAAKYRLTTDPRPLKIALRPSVKIPTARRPLGNRAWEAALIVPLEYAVPRSQLSIGLSPELGLAADDGGAGHHLTMTQVLGLAVPLARRVNASVEISGTWEWDSGGAVRQYVAGGSVAYLLSDDVQIDAGISLGLNRSASDVELYSGLAFRF